MTKSLNDESPMQKPPPKKSKAVDPSNDNDDVVIVEPPLSMRSSLRKSTKAKVPKSVAVKEEPSKDIVSGKRMCAQEAAEANNLASNSNETPVKVRTNSSKGLRPKSAVRVEYNPNVMFKVGSAKVLKASSEAEDDSATKSSHDDGQLTPAAPALSGNKHTQRRNSYEVDDEYILKSLFYVKHSIQGVYFKFSHSQQEWNPAARHSTIDEDSDCDIVSPTPKYKERSQSTKRDTLSAVEGAETRGSARFSSKQSKNKKPSLTDSDEDVAVTTKSHTSLPIKHGKDQPQATNSDSDIDQEEAIARCTISPSKCGRVQLKDGSESNDVFTDRSGKEQKSKGTKSDDQWWAVFLYPKMLPGDIPLFRSEYSDMPDAVMADQYTSFTWAHNFELSTDPPVRTSTSVMNIGSERHIHLRKTQKPVVFIYTGILSKVSHLVEPMHKNVNTHLTLQLQLPTDNCPWSGAVFASPCKGASTRGLTTGPLNPFQRRLLVESLKKASSTEKWEVPVSFQTFDDGSSVSSSLSHSANLQWSQRQ
ncbi:hypothetical protein ARMGADRAFT_1038600 [Armillaria gallica]|uniref:Uncharacterized protein n=1 Tax=Armillaria gallica TaxID=47427 RepID=A0A2H3CH65_ARMGA|nr:hypothetical protein ARMGADRAFT_1038600 [Armillaria gallica]